MRPPFWHDDLPPPPRWWEIVLGSLGFAGFILLVLFGGFVLWGP